MMIHLKTIAVAIVVLIAIILAWMLMSNIQFQCAKSKATIIAMTSNDVDTPNQASDKHDNEPRGKSEASDLNDSHRKTEITGLQMEESKKQLAAKLKELLTPPSVTSSDIEKAKVVNETLNNTGLLYWVLINMRPLLEADTNTTAFHTRASNQRADNGHIVTTIWSNKIGNTLEIDWSKGTIARKARKIELGPTFAETHSDQHGADNADIGWGYVPPEREQPCIAINKNYNDRNGGICIPYDHTNCFRVVGFISKTCPIAAMPNISEDTKKLVSVLMIDVDNSKLIGEIKFPKEAKTGRPNFILDQANDVLLITQFGIDWLVAVDLRPYLQKIKFRK